VYKRQLQYRDSSEPAKRTLVEPLFLPHASGILRRAVCARMPARSGGRQASSRRTPGAGSNDLERSSRERIAGIRIAAGEAGSEPALALRRRTVRERLGHHGATALAL